MSDNRKPPYDDDKTRVFNLNDDEKTRSFRIDDRGLNDDERDFFSDDAVEDLNTFATKKIDLGDKSSYNDEFNADLPVDKEGVSVYNDNFDNFTEEPYERTSGSNRERRPVNRKNLPKKKSKTPVVIGVVCVAAAIIIVVIILLLNSCSNGESPVDVPSTDTSKQSTASTSENITYTEDTTYIETTAEETTEPTTEPTTEETPEEETTQPPTTQKPTTADMFDATFAPYKCITPDGEVVSDDFNSVLGGDASVSFTSDGSYTLSVGSIANSSGSYTVDGNYLGLDGYSGTINFDDAGNPVAVIIDANGYKVYFN